MQELETLVAVLIWRRRSIWRALEAAEYESLRRDQSSTVVKQLMTCPCVDSVREDWIQSISI
jgi:hypothetical protein